MKKLVSFFICILIFLSIPLVCSADAQHNIPELGISLYLPEDLHIITRNTSASSSVWNKLDYIPEEHLAWMTKYDLYITAVSKSSDYEIIIGGVIGLSEEITSIASLDEKEQSNLYMKLYDETPGIRMPGFKDQIVRIGNKTFFIYDVYTSFDSASEGRMYFTIHNGKAIAVALAPSSGLIDEDDVAILESIASSINFSSVKSNVTTSNSNSSTSDSDNSSAGIVILILLGLILIVIIAVNISKKNSVENNFTDASPKEPSENHINKNQIKHETNTAERTQDNADFSNSKQYENSKPSYNNANYVEASFSTGEVEKEYSMLWFVYFTKIRPWIQIILLFSSFNEYASSKIGLGCFIVLFILQLNLFFKSWDKTTKLFLTIKKYLIYNFWIGVLNMIASPLPEMFNSNEAILGMLMAIPIALLFWYFIWYRLNINYFKRRLIPPEKPVITINLNHTFESQTITFCTKCGAKLQEGTKFCPKCGTKIV